MSFCWDNVSVKRGGRIDGAKRGAGGCRQYVIPFFLSSLPLQKYVLWLHKFGGNVVNLRFYSKWVMISFLSKWVRWLHEFGKMVVNSVFGMSHKIKVKSRGTGTKLLIFWWIMRSN